MDCDAAFFPDDELDLSKRRPLFYVQPAPSVRSSEGENQATFLGAIRQLAPTITVWATPNAGKRGFKAQAQVKREGLRKGAFDLNLSCDGRFGILEFKGHDARGRPGVLSDHQIDFGNAVLLQGHWVACFFDPWAAINRLRGCGWPVRAAR